MKQKITPTAIDVKKYGGKQVAIVGGQVVASGRTSLEVLEKARSQMPARPLKDIKIFAVPRTIDAIYHA